MRGSLNSECLVRSIRLVVACVTTSQLLEWGYLFLFLKMSDHLMSCHDSKIILFMCHVFN